MRTAPIQTHKASPQLPQPVPQEQNSNLYDEFSETLDKIASKVLRSQNSQSQLIPAAETVKVKKTPKVTVKTSTEVEKPKRAPETHAAPPAENRDVQRTGEDSSERPEPSPAPNDEGAADVAPQPTAAAQAPEAAKEAKNKGSESERPIDEAADEGQQDTEQEQVLVADQNADPKELITDNPQESGETIVQSQGEIEVAEAKDTSDVVVTDELVKEEQGGVVASDQSVDAAPQLVSDPVATQTTDSQTSPEAPVETSEILTAPVTQEAALQPTTEGQVEDISVPSNNIQEFTPPTAPEVDAKSAQDLLSRTLEKLIQTKLLEAAANETTGTQREAAFQIAREAQRAQTVIAQINQNVTGISGKGATTGQGQAQGLHFNDLGTFRQADSSRGDEPRGPGTLTRPQAVRTMERVENALKEVSKSKDGKTISVRLDPPELGSVKVDVSYKDGGIHARIAAEQGSVVHLLKERTQELVVMIRKLGLNVEKVTVTVSNQGEQNAGTLGNFESFKDGSSASNQGRQNGRRFGVEQGAVDTRPLNPAADDHWIA